MGIFDIFKKKKVRVDILSKFNFKKAPTLLEIYKEYMELRLKTTSLSRKDVKNNKYEKAAEIRDNYAQNVVAKEIWNIFNPISPTLYNADKDEYIDWEKLFDKNFEQLSVKQRRYLIGLIEGDYIYELPKEYYNN